MLPTVARLFLLLALCASTLFPLTSTPSQARSAPAEDFVVEWQDECVYCQRFHLATNRSLVADGLGHLHVAYGGDKLYYAVKIGNNLFTSEVVDPSPNVGQFAAIATDAGNQPHIAYYDAANSALKYATRQSGVWSVETVLATGDSGQHPSIVARFGNRPMIAFRGTSDAAAAPTLMFAEKIDGVWNFTRVDASPSTGFFTSIDLNSSNEPQIAYQKSNTADLRFARRSSNTWSTFVVDSANAVGEFASLAVDSTNKVHLAYYDATTTALKYGSLPSGSNTWNLETVISDGNVGRFTSLELNGAGLPRISFFEARNNRIQVARRASNNTWSFASVGFVAPVGFTALTTANLVEGVHVLYETTSPAPNDTGFSGQLEAITIGSQAGSTTNPSSLAIDIAGHVSTVSAESGANGQQHVAFTAFRNGSARQLHYGKRGANGIWQISTVDANNSSAQPDLFLQGETPHIAYVALNTIIYAFYNGSSWTLEQIINGVSVSNPQIVVTSSGVPQITFLQNDSGSISLRRGQRINNVWNFETVAPATINENLNLTISASDQVFAFFVRPRPSEPKRIEFVQSRFDGANWAATALSSFPASATAVGKMFGHGDLTTDSTGFSHAAMTTQFLNQTGGQNVLDLPFLHQNTIQASGAAGSASLVVGIQAQRLAVRKDGSGRIHRAELGLFDGTLRYNRSDFASGGREIAAQLVSAGAGPNPPARPLALTLDELVRPNIYFSKSDGLHLLRRVEVPLNPIPLITSISHAHISTVSSNLNLVILGGGFAPLASVQVNGVNLTPSKVTSNQVNLSIPPANLLAGANLISVTNPTPGGGVSNEATLQIGAVSAGASAMLANPGQSIPGRAVNFSLNWEHPTENWRALHTYDFWLEEIERQAIRVRYTEAFTNGVDASTFSLLDANGEVLGSGRPGEDLRLESETAWLVFSQTRFQGSGPNPENRSMTLHITVIFKSEAAGATYQIFGQPLNDDGETQEPEALGEFRLVTVGSIVALPWLSR